MYQLGHGGYYNNKIYGKYSCRFKGREAVLAVMNNVQQCNVQQRNVQQCSFSKREKLLYERFRSGLETDGAAGRPFMDDSCGCFSRPFSTLKCCGNIHDFVYFYVLALNIYDLKINYY